MTWQIVTAANAVIGLAYLAIAWLVASGLVKSGQLGVNTLGLATALIFLSCGVHHGTHALHMLLPSLGVDDPQAIALREAWHWPSAVWDIASAAVAVFYLSLRGSYGDAMRGPQMFEDLRRREQQALEINDNIVQGLTVARYALEQGREAQSKEAVERTLTEARGIITELLGAEGVQRDVRPGRLRREKAASGVSRGALSLD